MSDIFKVVKLVDAPVVISGNVTLSGGIAAAASGNTAGTMATLTNGTLVLAGGNNITLSQSQNTISIVGGAGGAGGGVAISAGTNSTSTGTVVFANSNGVSFGMNTNGVVTGTVQTNYLTTAMASDAGTNFVATSNSSLFQHTSATSAITSNAMNTSERGNYFYTSNNTFANSTHTHGNLALTNLNGTSASDGLSLSAAIPTQTEYVFSNSNGVSFGTNGSTVTATVRTDYLTTAANSTHTHGNIAFGGTNVSGSFTSASNGLSISLSGGAGAAGNTGYLSAGTTNASLGTVTFGNGNGVSFGINGQTLTASVGNAVRGVSITGGPLYTNSTVVLGSGGAISFASFTNGSGFQVYKYPVQLAHGVDSLGNTSGITETFSFGDHTSFGPANVDRGLYFRGGNNITAHGSTDGNTLTIEFNGPDISNFLTTAAQSNHSHGNPTLALTNLTGTTASASNGLTISLSAAAPGAAAENNWFNLTGNTVGNTTASGSTIVLSAGNNVTLSGTNNSVIRIDAGGGGAGYTASELLHPYEIWANAQTAQGPFQNTNYLNSMHVQHPVAWSWLKFMASNIVTSSSFASTANTTVTFGQSEQMHFVVYTRETNTASTILKSIGSVSGTMSYTVALAFGSATNTTQTGRTGFTGYDGQTYSSSTQTSNLSTFSIASNSRLAGVRVFPFPWTSSLSAGVYWVAWGRTTSATTNGINMSGLRLQMIPYYASQINAAFFSVGDSVSGNLGVGSISLGAGNVTSATLTLSNLTTGASHLMPMRSFVSFNT